MHATALELGWKRWGLNRGQTLEDALQVGDHPFKLSHSVGDGVAELKEGKALTQSDTECNLVLAGV